MELKELGLQDLQIDFSNNSSYLSPLYAKEGDVGTRGIRLQILNNGVAFDATGVDVKLFSRPSKQSEVYELPFTETDATKGEYEVIYTTDMLVPGIVYCEIALKDSLKNEKISHKKLKLLVDSGFVTDSAIEGHDSYPLFEQLLDAGANEIARQDAELVREQNEDTRIANETQRITDHTQRGVRLTDLEDEVAQGKLDYDEYKESKMLHDLDNNKKYNINLEVSEGQPRIKIEEVM